MRVTAKLNSKPRPRRTALGADADLEQHQLQLIELHTDAMRISQTGSLGETGYCKSGIFQGASYCALKIPKGPLKLLILLVAGAGFEPATFGL